MIQSIPSGPCCSGCSAPHSALPPLPLPPPPPVALAASLHGRPWLTAGSRPHWHSSRLGSSIFSSRSSSVSAQCSTPAESSALQGAHQPSSSSSSGGSAGSSSGGSACSSNPVSITAAHAARQGCTPAPTGWHPLDHPSIWKGTEEDAVFRQATPYPLNPTWKVLLLSDGSVTRHLQLMTNRQVKVECLEMRNIGEQREGLPEETRQIPGPLVQRQVLLHIPEPHSRAYVYATSWWNADTVDQYLRDKSRPIWVSLSEGRTELYRDILQLELGNCPFLEERFQASGPFWGRQYLFWHNGKPLTLIYEVFSSQLEEFLGSQTSDSSSRGGSGGSE